MKGTSKRLLSLLLVFCMLFSMMPVSVFATGDDIEDSIVTIDGEEGSGSSDAAVAKVGNMEYATIDEAIANWTNNTTLTLLDDVTLTDVITLKSTEHHILNLGTYTMTAASGKDAIVIQACGTGSAERSAITINADATDPGGINAGNKRVIYYKYADGGISTEDRPIIKINGGVFTGSTASFGNAGIYTIGTAARKCATVNITGGTFNCSILGSGKSKLLISGGTFNYSVSSQGDSTCLRLISGGTFKTIGFMTADSNNTKFWIGTSMGKSDVGAYVDDNGYIVIGGPVVTEAGETFQASATYSGASSYLQYSSAKDNGLYYTSVEEAFADNNNTTGSVTVYVDELDMTDVTYKGTIVVPEGETITIKTAKDDTPAWTVSGAENAVTYVDAATGEELVKGEDGKFESAAPAVTYVAYIGQTGYTTLADAVDKAASGDTVTVTAGISDEAISVDKNITITGTATLNNVSINADGADELTVSGLSFTGNSWINSGTAEKLTVSGVTANVTPSNTAYTNSRSAFISLGRSEQQQLELTVENCNIVSAGGSNPILGWAAITKATISGNTFGSDAAYQTNSDSIKFMAIADGAEFTITGNTIYSNYNGIVFGQNTTRDNAYTAVISGNTFVGSADHVWIEVSGSNTTKATIKATSDNTVNGMAFTAGDIKVHPNITTWISYAGVDVETDKDGKVIGGVLAFAAADAIAEGYELDKDGKVVQTAPAYVAQVGETKYTDLQEAIKAAAPSGTVELLNDVTVDEWVMITETLTIGTGQLITLDSINGLTIDGNGHILTIKDIESASNGGHLFYDATKLNVQDLTINVAEGLIGGIGLTSGTISNVTFIGGAYGVLPGTGNVAITGCTFETNGTAIYFETERDNLTVTGNTFDLPSSESYAIILRGGADFTKNEVKSGKVNLAASASGTVSGNDFGENRFKVYNEATATISGNTINNLVFNDATPTQAAFEDNTLSESAQVALNAVMPGLSGTGTEADPYQIKSLKDLKWFRDDVNSGNTYQGKYIVLTDDIDLEDEDWTPIGKGDGFKGTFDGKGKTISNLLITGNNSTVGLFANTYDGEIKNLTVSNAKVSGRLNVGVVAGNPYTSKYTNINVTGHVEVNGMSYVGGVGGKNAYANWTDITVNVDNTSYVKATSTENGTAYRTYVGGVIGFIGEGGHTFKNISSNIKVIGDVCDIGGLFGIAHYGNKFENVTFTGAVEAPKGAKEVGGIAGVWHNQAGQTVTFTGVTSTGNVTIGTETTTGSVVGGAYNAGNETSDTSGSLVINGQEAWLKVAAIGEDKYTSLQDAIEAVQNDETITLLSDVNVTTAAYGQNALNHARAVNFTLDLNGKTLSADTGNSVLRFNIANSSATSDVTVTVKNGKVVSGSNTWCALMASGVSSDIKAVMNLEDLTVESSKAGDLAIKAWDNSVINAKNVNVNATKGAGGFYALGGEVVLDNCTVNQKGLHTAPYLSMAIAVSNNGKMTVNSGTYSSEPTAAAEGNNQGTSHGSWVGGVMNSGGTLIINDGTFTNGNFGEDELATAARGLICTDTGAVLEINGGTFNALKNVIDIQNNLGDASKNPTVTLKGGTFSSNPTNDNTSNCIKLVEGYEVVETDGVYEVVKAALKLEGEGTAEVPYQISSKTELEDFRDSVNAGNTYAGVYFQLTDNVDLAASAVMLLSAEVTPNWEPIGTKDTPFKGVFDGNGKTISNLIVVGEANQGLFGYGDNATIKNVTINNATVIGTDCVGAVAGQVYSTSLIDNCHVTGSIKIEGQTNVGGIVGKYYTKVTNCSVIGDGVDTSYVKGVYVQSDLEGDNIGGIMGHCGENNTLTGNTVKNITVSGTRKVAGIVGIADQNTDVSGCVVENVVIETTATADYADSKVTTMSIGGLIGQYQAAGSNNNGTVTDCLIKNVTFNNVNDVTVDVGPIVGGARGGSTGMLPPSAGITASGNDIYMSTVTGSSNSYLMVAVADVNGETYYSLQDAIDHANGKTVKLVNDVVVTNTVTVPTGKTVTLELNGKTISQSKACTEHYVMVENRGTLTVQDTAGGGKISFTDTGVGDNKFTWGSYTVANYGTLTVESGTIENLSKQNANGSVRHMYCAIQQGGSAVSTTINGGTISTPSYRSVRANTGALVINGGNFEGQVWIQPNQGNATLSITGGTFAPRGVDGSSVFMTNAGEGYTVTEAAISGGTFTTKIGASDPAALAGSITGGQFTASAKDNTSAALLAKGFEFSGEVNVEGYYTVNEIKVYVAQIGEQGYETLAEAFTAAQNGDEVKILAAGTYALSTSGKNITITGAVDGVVFDNIGAKNMGGANVTFNNVTFDYYPNVNYTGLQHSGNLIYNNCTFNGQVFLYGTSETFNKCTFNQNSADAYNVWTYGAKEVEFKECTFNSAGKSVLIYSEAANLFNDVTVTDCDFIASADVEGKAAIEMDSSLTAGINLTIDSATTATGFGFGNVSGNSLWNNKKGNNTDANNDITVVVGNETVLAPVTFVAQIGDVKYATLQSALDAAVAGTGNVTVEILSDIDLTNVDWNPVTVSASGYPLVTVNGNSKTITGLNDMLFAGTWAGKSGLIINDLTIKDSNIVNDENDEKGTVGVGAFIGFPQASATITLNNCHLVDSTVKGGHWTGGLIGYAAGYAGNDGPVFMNLTITGCSVTGSTITGKGSAGGVIGHGSGNGWTNVVITDTTVSGNTITSTGSSTNKAGSVMGTIGAAGQPTTANGETKTGGAFVAAAVSGNTVTSGGTAITTIYGRQGTETGVLTLTGGTYDSYPIEENVSYAQPKEGYEIVKNADGTYGLVVDPIYGKVAKIGDSYYETLAAAINAAQAGATITLIDDIEENVTIAESLTIDGNQKQYTGTITINGKINVTVQNLDAVKGYIAHTGVNSNGTLTVKNCTFTDGGYAITTARIKSVTIEDCTVTNQSLLYAKLSTPSIMVKDTTVSGGNYGAHVVYGSTVHFDNVKMDNMIYGIESQNHGAKNYTIKNCEINAQHPIDIWEKATATDTFVFEGENIIPNLAANDYAAFELVPDATLAAPGGLNIKTAEGYEDYEVRYADGVYSTIKPVAKAGEVTYDSLDAAIKAAVDGDTVTLLTDITLTDADIQTVGSYKVLFNVEGKNITLDLNDKTITVNYNGTKYQDLIAVVRVADGAGLTVTGNGTIDVPSNGINVAYMFWKAGTTGYLTIENGTYHMDNSADSMVYTNGHEIVTVKGGTWTLDEVGTRPNRFPCFFNVQGSGDHSIIITGGTYNDDINHQHWGNEAVVPATHYVQNNGDGTWTVKSGAVASVDLGTLTGPYFVAKDFGFATFEEAFAAADDGNTVTLLTDVALSKTIKVNNSVTLDLAGKTISGTENATGSFALIEIQPGADLTVNDTVGTGKITLTAANNRGWNAYSSVISNQRGTLTVNGGTIEHLGGTDMAYAIDNLTNTGAQNAETTINGGTVKSTYRAIRQFANSSTGMNTLTITGGTVKSTGGNRAVWLQSANASANMASMTITGGTVGAVYVSAPANGDASALTLAVDANCVTEVVDGLPEGYKILKSNDTYVIVTVHYVAQIEGGAKYETLAAALEAAKGETDIVINLLDDATLDITAWQTLAIGGETTESITINGNGNTLTFNKKNSDWNHVATNNDAKLILNDVTLADSGYNNGPWNRYDINFACDVELNNVTSNKALAFKAGAELNNVTINESGDNYAIWIQANGQTVAIDGLTVNSAGRGIKIDEQYVDNASEVTLTVENADFNTAKKAAIVVKSVAGAAITTENVDISGVAADTTNVVWVDEDSGAVFGNVIVDGEYAVMENVESFAATTVANGVFGYYKTLAEAIEVSDDSTVALLANNTEEIVVDEALTINRTESGYTANITAGEGFEVTTTETAYVVAEKVVEVVDYKFGQSVQIGLIEPWFLKANVRVYTDQHQDNIPYEDLTDYGAYFVRASQLSDPNATQDTLTVNDIVDNTSAVHYSKSEGTAEIDGSYITATFDEGLYTYEMSDSVFVLFYIVDGENTYYAPIRERNLKELLEARKDDEVNFTNVLERDVYSAMSNLETSITEYRAQFDKIEELSKQDAPTLAEYVITNGEFTAETVKSYSFGNSVQIVLIEPWGLKVNARVYNSANPTNIDYNAVDDYGVIVYYDVDGTIASGTMTAEELMKKEDAYVFSSSNGDATVDGSYITAIYNKDIFTYMLNSNAYVMFYVKDDDGYHYGDVKVRNIYELAGTRSQDTTGTYGELEKAVYGDMVDVYDAVTAYRKDYFENENN